MSSKSSTFYFIHQIKLQTLPYVEKEITQFIQYFTDHFSLQDQAQTQQQKDEWHKKTKIIYAVMEKKLKQIQDFHYNNWMDYRANLVLRPKKLLIQFYQANKNFLFSLKSQTVSNNIPSDQIYKNLLIEQIQNHDQQVVQQHQNSLQKDTQKYLRVKDSVKRIKTEMVEKTSKPNPTIKNVKKVQAKQTKKGKNSTVNITKQQINKQISKIIDKSHNNDKPKTNLVFASRRPNEPKIDNTKKQKPNNLQNTNSQKNHKTMSKNINNTLSSKQKQQISQRFERSLQKQLNKSKEKATQSINKSKEKPANKNVLTKETEVNIGKKTTKEQDKQKKAQVASKNMSKEEYIQYLINKNKMNISTTKF